MRENFLFYKSYYEAISLLGEKSQLKLYKSIMKMYFNCCENVTEMERLCDEIETEIKQNRNVYATFLLIKPTILKSIKNYHNGLKGKNYGTLGGEYGKLGGRPQKPPEKPPTKEEEKEKEKDIERNFIKKEKNKIDPYINPISEKFQKEYERIFGSKPFLTNNERLKIVELNSDIPDFPATIPAALAKLKKIEFDLPNFNPNANWLLKNDNYTAVLNGTYDKKEDKKIDYNDFSTYNPNF